MLSLQSKIQCRDRSDPFSGEVIKSSLVHETSRCMKNAERKKNCFLSPLFFLFNVSAKQFPSVKWLFPALWFCLWMPVPGFSILFGGRWGSGWLWHCAVRRTGSTEGCRGWMRDLRSCKANPGFAPVIAPPWAGSCSGLALHHLPMGRVLAQTRTPGRTTLPSLMGCLLVAGWHAVLRHFQRLLRADGPQQRASIE